MEKGKLDKRINIEENIFTPIKRVVGVNLRVSGQQLAEQFHKLYEELAPQFGYETREETRIFNPESNNGKLMIAVSKRILEWLSR